MINKQGTRAWVDELRLAQRLGGRSADRPGDRTRSATPRCRRPARRRRSSRSARRCSSARAATSTGPPGPRSRPASGSRARAGSPARAATSRGSPTASSGRSAPGRASRCRSTRASTRATATEQKILNYSAIFDEVEDFELNIRNVSGPGPLAAAGPLRAPRHAGQPATSAFDPNHGLIIGDNGNINLPPCVINAIPAKANADRQQVTRHAARQQHGRAGADGAEGMGALRRSARRTARSRASRGGASRLNPRQVQAGRALFAQAGCANCHGGTLFSNSVKDYVSPPAAAEIVHRAHAAGARSPATRSAPRTSASSCTNIGSFNLGVPGQGNDLGNNIGAVEMTTSGFNAGTQQTTAPGGARARLQQRRQGQRLHDPVAARHRLGAALLPQRRVRDARLRALQRQAPHGQRDRGGPDTARRRSAADRARVVAFLRSID